MGANAIKVWDLIKDHFTREIDEFADDAVRVRRLMSEYDEIRTAMDPVIPDSTEDAGNIPGEWISIEDGLPTEPGTYTVMTRNNIARYVYSCTESSAEYWRRCVVLWKTHGLMRIKEKECQYCQVEHGRKFLFHFPVQILCDQYNLTGMIVNDKLKVRLGGNRFHKDVSIRRCPMCGRLLKEENKSGQTHS